ncbi:MAG TPA: class I SAM-dependent methyltransferase [Vicinamibacteria bacterium]|nr:class I SAM-dependent methyltransferase [Vicinamibacteria bacterium]
MAKTTRDSEDRAVLRTLESTYCPAPIREARERQDSILAERFSGREYAIADVGCGTGYHGSIFAPGCFVYHGFEISPEIARVARDRWEREGLRNAEVFVGDIANAELVPGFYDLALCLYFTPGNIRDESEDLSLYTDAYLDRNPRFIAVISRLLEALKKSGKMFLTIYKDVPEAEDAQIDFYEHTGQHVITPKGSRFVATAERFWSVRWTRRSLLSNVAECGVKESAVVFHDLNPIAWLVEITKH